MRGRGLTVALLLLALGLAAAAPARAAYVYFHRAFGDWSVTCWLDEPSKRKSCALSAPPPRLDGRPPPGRIRIQETAPGQFRVTLRVLDPVAPGTAVTLEVAGVTPLSAFPDRYGVASWTGSAAADLVTGMTAGGLLALRSYPDPGGPPREGAIALTRFADALDAYRAKMRAAEAASPG